MAPPYTKKRTLKEGTHAHDVYITGVILEQARKTGIAVVEGTPDGDVYIYYDKGMRKYSVTILVDDEKVDMARSLRHDIQEYLIDLRVQARKQKHGRKAGVQEDT